MRENIIKELKYTNRMIFCFFENNYFKENATVSSKMGHSGKKRIFFIELSNTNGKENIFSPPEIFVCLKTISAK